MLRLVKECQKMKLSEVGDFVTLRNRLKSSALFKNAVAFGIAIIMYVYVFIRSECFIRRSVAFGELLEGEKGGRSQECAFACSSIACLNYNWDVN